MKKHPGRPKVGTQNAKGVMVAVRVTPPEAKQLDQAIREARQSRSNWLRQALLTAAGGNKSVA